MSPVSTIPHNLNIGLDFLSRPPSPKNWNRGGGAPARPAPSAPSRMAPVVPSRMGPSPTPVGNIPFNLPAPLIPT